MQVITEEKVIEKKRWPGLSKKNELNPVAGNERINSLDVMRGIAVLGILIMNVVGFGLAFAYEDPTVSGGSHSLNYKVWAFTEIFVEGTMRGLFTMLFGVGFMIFVSRGEKKALVYPQQITITVASCGSWFLVLSMLMYFSGMVKYFLRMRSAA